MDPIEEMMREEIQDGGFTLRVLTALPPRRARPRVRGAVLFASAAAAGTVAIVLASDPLSAILRPLVTGAATPAALAGLALALLATWACAGLATSD